MSVAAAKNCLGDIDPTTVDGLYFASASPPYNEKQSAATIATVLGMGRETLTMDFADSLRAGSNAIRAAADAVESGSLESALVCIADCRLPMPNGANEMNFGDAAAALLIGRANLAAHIDGLHTMCDELIDVFRSDKERYVRSWEARFIRDEGYNRVIPQAVSAALAKHKVSPGDFAKAVIYSPDTRQLRTAAKMTGFDYSTQVQGLFHEEIGDSGNATTALGLIAALEESGPGDKLLVASYGNGADVLLLTVSDGIGLHRPKRRIRDYLNAKLMISSYQSYLRWRGLLDIESPATAPMEQPSPAALWRDNYGGLRLHGVKCKKCGTPQYPVRRVCMKCGSKDDFEDYSFADRIGEVATFSHDNMGISADPPNTIAAVDFPEGGRIMCDMTDRDPEEVEIGMPVEMVFRQLRYVGGFYTYWWKCRPLRFQ
jgi:3-hydroxy-3-methylglutaryl CoA synthase